jgi:hypothetical protein
MYDQLDGPLCLMHTAPMQLPAQCLAGGDFRRPGSNLYK